MARRIRLSKKAEKELAALSISVLKTGEEECGVVSGRRGVLTTVRRCDNRAGVDAFSIPFAERLRVFARCLLEGHGTVAVFHTHKDHPHLSVGDLDGMSPLLPQILACRGAVKMYEFERHGKRGYRIFETGGR